jgi:YD repeat-containing protein
MRPIISGVALVSLLSQPAGTAFAAPHRASGSTGTTTSVLSPILAIAGGSSYGGHPQPRHTPLPLRKMADYSDRRRYAELILRPHGAPLVVHAPLPIDLVKLRQKPEERRFVSESGAKAHASLALNRHGTRNASLSASLTGLWPWWTYDARTIPGVGKAMVNVANMNFLIEEDDVDIPEGGIDLAFRRMYNSQSQHDATGDDGTTPSVYGNRWTNNFDIHLGWTPGIGNTGTVSVYTGDGARDDYTCSIAIAATCTSNIPGVHDLLATTDLNNNIACQLQWTRKSGTTYIFDAPYSNCASNLAGYYGRLLTIYARNINFSIQLAYSWVNNNATNPENLSTITATHKPDGSNITLTFGQITGTTITELSSIALPDGNTVNYHYNSNGELTDVDKPGNNPVLVGETMPTTFLDGAPIAKGNLPETYDITHPQSAILEACGPRAAIAIINNQTSPIDGACVDFEYDNHQLSNWWTRGVLNPTPQDAVSPSAIQNGPSTGFVQWDDTTFFDGIIETCGLSTIISDAYGHTTTWCYDSSSRVTQTSAKVSSSSSVTSSQTWDLNDNLTSTTAARGNITTIGYDADGNVVEVSQPQQTTIPKGTITPTSFYDYDQYNNVIRYCDPANNSNNNFVPPTDSLCQTYGTNYAQYTYSSDSGQPDSNEIYGCLTATTTPSTYQTLITYNGNGGGGSCGTGLPTKAAAATGFPQDDQNMRTPTQKFGYNTNNNGTLTSYNAGNGAWQINYSSDGMNRVSSRVDPDGVASYSCYNLDGSVFYSETALQNELDGGDTCPSDQALQNGNPTAPAYAASYRYDPDGDLATELRHHECTIGSGNCAANNATGSCNNATVNSGTACKFYDGLDRLVEVKQPYDTKFDLYTNPWITRYLYDLTGQQYSFDQQSFYAYGNLYSTEELLPPGSATISLTWGPGGPISQPVNTSYQAVKATAFDGLDRAVMKYSLVAGGSGEQLNTETLTWDTSPLGNGNVSGFLGKDCNAVGQCQQFDYTPDGQQMTFNSNDGSSPKRSYVYDPDGRVASITSAAYGNPQQYTYDVDGRLSTSVDAGGSGGVTSAATLTHNYYPDGTQESLGVSSSALTQSKLFEYSYRSDGRKEWEQLDDTSLRGSYNASYGQTELGYTFSAAGRLTKRTESGVGANSTPVQVSYYLQTGNITGLEQSVSTPSTSLANMTYSAESELLTLTAGGASNGYTYTLRGEQTCAATNCLVGGLRLGQMLGNGLSVRQPTITQRDVQYQSQTDDQMAVITHMGQTNCGSNWCPTSSWSYDQAGRLTTEVGPVGSQSVTGSVTRCYDAENHPTGTDGSCSGPTEAISWGPNGHPLTIATSGSTETLHWDGGQMLFATRKVNGQDSLDDIKIDTQGDVLPQDPGYSGLTFFERGPGGGVMGCHNANGAVYAGLADVWTRGWGILAQDLNPCYQQSGNMPTSIDWYGTPLISGSELGLPIGQGGVLGMPRTDGLTDNYDTIQGVRSYSSTAGTWTAPDAYAGDVHNPGSQKSYMWNGNNPVSYSDPTGFDAEFQGQVGAYIQPLLTDYGSDPPLVSTNTGTGCDAKDKANDCFKSGQAVSAPGANQTDYKSLDAAAQAAQNAAEKLGLTPSGTNEIGCAVYCISKTDCGFGDFQIGTSDDVGVDLSEYKSDAQFGVGIWHLHSDGSEEASTYGHDANNNRIRAEYPWLHGHTFTIYTTYGSPAALHAQDYGGLVPAEEGKVYVPPRLIPPM